MTDPINTRSDIVERLRKPSNTEEVMKCWDMIRSYLLKGGSGSYARDVFESILSNIDEERDEAAAEIERLRSPSSGTAVTEETGDLPQSPWPASDWAIDRIDRLEAALRKISSPTQTDGLLWWQVEARAALSVQDTAPTWPAGAKFAHGDRVRKHSGSWWEGVIVGFYSTTQTPIGYDIQMDMVPNGPTQIYPEGALEAAPARETPAPQDHVEASRDRNDGILDAGSAVADGSLSVTAGETAPTPASDVVGERKRNSPFVPVPNTGTFVPAKAVDFTDIIATLDEAHGFAALSPAGKENIEFAIAKLEEALAASEGSTDA